MVSIVTINLNTLLTLLLTEFITMTHKLTTFVSGNHSLLSASDDKNILRGVTPLEILYSETFLVDANGEAEFIFPFPSKVVALRYPPVNCLFESLHDTDRPSIPVIEGQIFAQGEAVRFASTNLVPVQAFLYYTEVILNPTP